MLEHFTIETLGEHRYLVRAQQGEEPVEILVRASPTVIARLAPREADESRVIEETLAFLVARQRADDLPPQLDVDEILATYEDFEDDLRGRLHARDRNGE